MSAANGPTAAFVAPYIPPLHVGDTVPDVRLVDQLGRRFSLVRDGRVTVVSFAYTRCPDPAMCSLVTTKFQALQRSFAGTDVRLVEVTLDPANDRSATLRTFARAVGARHSTWLFGTGTESDIESLSQRFGMVRERVAWGYRHSETVAILSATGSLRVSIGGSGWNPDDVAAQARAERGVDSNPLQRFALQALARASAICGSAGVGGYSLVGGLAVFAVLALAFGRLAVHLFSPMLAGKP